MRVFLPSVLVLCSLAGASRAQEYTASLSGANEVPPNGSTATATATFTLNPNNTLTYTVSASGLTATAAHVHRGAVGVNGPVVFPLTGGPVRFAGTSPPLSGADLAALAAAQLYVNVHTNQFPGGEIRDQLHAKVTYEGLPHTTLGAATLSTDASGKLKISNLGSSGCDGVSISLGEAQFHVITLDAGGAQLQTGASVSVKSKGEVNGVPDQDIWTMRVEDLGSLFGLSLDASPVQPASLRVDLRLNGQTVASQPAAPQPGQPLAIFAPEGCTFDPVWPMNPDVWAILTLAGPGQVSFPGLPPVTADEIAVVASNLGATVGALSSTEVTGDVGSLVLAKESLGMFHKPITAIDDAHITGAAGGNSLIISNLGSSGCDGVSIDYGQTDSAFLEMAPLSLAQPGSSMTLSSTGSFSGNPNTFLGEGGLRNVNGSLEAFVDFSPLGATQVRLEVWRGAAFQGSAVVPNGGVIASVQAGPSGILASIDGCGKLPPDPPCLWINLDDDVVVTPTGKSALPPGDQLRILADNAAGSIDFLQTYQISAGDVPSVEIHDATHMAFVPYGQGCAGTGGFIPELSMSGAAVAGGTVTLSIDKGLGPSAAILLLGLTPASIPVGGGCKLLVTPVLTSLTLPLFGAGPGTGQVAIPTALPPSASGLSLTMQAFVLDPGTVLGAAGSNGLMLSIE